MASTALKKPHKPRSITKLMKDVDKVFSDKVRKVDPKRPLLRGKCFTCKKSFLRRKLQCGHYLSRFYKAARWDYDNARPQCMMCNMWKRGDLVVFRANLVKEIGIERVEAVEAKRFISTKLTSEFLVAKLAEL